MAKVGTLSVILRAVTGPFRRGLRRASRAIKRFKTRVVSTIKTVARWAMRLGVIMGAVGSAIIAYSVKQAANFERIKIQLEVLLGTAEKANESFTQLKSFAAKTPFEIAEVASMAKILHAMSQGLLNNEEMWKKVGGAAAMTGARLDDVAGNVGRLYASLQAGGLGRGGIYLFQKGIISSDTYRQIKEMSAEARKSGKAWAMVQKDLERWKNAMEKLSNTAHGLFSTVKDNIVQVAAQFGEPLLNPIKNAMRRAIEYMGELRKSGKLEEWAATTIAAFKKVLGFVVPAVVSLANGVRGAVNFIITALNGGQKGFSTFATFVLQRINDIEFALTHLPDLTEFVFAKLDVVWTKFKRVLVTVAALAKGLLTGELFTKAGVKDLREQFALSEINREVQQAEKRAAGFGDKLGNKYEKFILDVKKRNAELAKQLEDIFKLPEKAAEKVAEKAKAAADAIAKMPSKAGAPLVERQSVAGFRMERGIVDRADELRKETADNTRDIADGIEAQNRDGIPINNLVQASL